MLGPDFKSSTEKKEEEEERGGGSGSWACWDNLVWCHVLIIQTLGKLWQELGASLGYKHQRPIRHRPVHRSPQSGVVATEATRQEGLTETQIYAQCVMIGR